VRTQLKTTHDNQFPWIHITSDTVIYKRISHPVGVQWFSATDVKAMDTSLETAHPATDAAMAAWASAIVHQCSAFDAARQVIRRAHAMLAKPCATIAASQATFLTSAKRSDSLDRAPATSAANQGTLRESVNRVTKSAMDVARVVIFGVTAREAAHEAIVTAVTEAGATPVEAWTIKNAIALRRWRTSSATTATRMATLLEAAPK